MQMTPYLSFNGDCEAAFKLYEQCLGGQAGPMFRYAGSPLADQVPSDWSNKIMHGSLTLGDQVLMGGDVAPDQYREPQGISLRFRSRALLTPSASFTSLPRAAGSWCRSRRHSGPRVSGWSSIASAYRG